MTVVKFKKEEGEVIEIKADLVIDVNPYKLIDILMSSGRLKMPVQIIFEKKSKNYNRYMLGTIDCKSNSMTMDLKSPCVTVLEYIPENDWKPDTDAFQYRAVRVDSILSVTLGNVHYKIDRKF